MSTGYEPDWQGTVRTILDGGEVRRDLLLWNIGIDLSCHPIHLLAYSRSNDPKMLNPSEMSGGTGWESRATGIRFYRYGERSMDDQERTIHSVNGCSSCRDAIKPGMSAAERASVTGTCKDPKVYYATQVETVRWTEVARFLKPALTEDRVAAMSDFMKRRYDHTAKRDGRVTYLHHQATPEQVEAFRTDRAAEQREWFTLEDEGRRLAREAWDAALAVEVGKRIGVLF